MSEDVEIRRRRRAIWIAVVTLSLPLVFGSYQRMHGINMLKAKLHDLKRAGEEIEIQKLERPPTAVESNALARLTNHFKALQDLDNLFRSRPPSGQSEADSNRHPYLQLSEWEFKVWVGDSRETQTNRWAAFVTDFEPQTNLLNQVIDDLRRPGFDTGYRPSQGFASIPTAVHLGLRDVEKLLACGFSYHLHAGRLVEADECLRSLLRLIDGMGNERIIITELLRMGSWSTAHGLVWHSLQIDGWSDEQLAAWSDAIDRLDFGPAMTDAFRVERAMAYSHFRRLGGKEGTDLERKRTWKTAWESMDRSAVNEWFHVPLWYLIWQEQDYVVNLQTWNASVNYLRSTLDAGWFAVLNHSATNPLPHEPIEFAAPKDNWLNSHRYLFSAGATFYAGPSAERVVTNLIRKHQALIAIAIRRYELRRGQAPPDLQALVPTFLKQVPLDPIDRKPMRYRRDAESWQLYSIGKDGVDDGGDMSSSSFWKSSNSVLERKDIVWPQPAN